MCRSEGKSPLGEKTIQLAPSNRKPKPLQEENNSTRQHERNNSTQHEKTTQLNMRKQLNSAAGMKQLDSAPPAPPLQQNWLFLSTGRFFRWSLKLSMFDYEVKYLKGTNNVEAGMLSRHPIAQYIQHSVHLFELN
ncbi:transposon Tf2-6 polyprotein [Trichonephila clavipes]|nr:transposon Tf2-6 polyprotein [Trichonephila clavipes]